MKKIIIIILTVFIIGGIGYYGLNSDTNQKATPESIKIGMAVYPGYGTFYIAQEKEFFKKEGVNVELVPLSLDAMFPALASNEVQMLVGSADSMAIIADAGIPAKQIFSTSISNGADGVLVTKNVTSILDLKGEKVYLALGFPNHFFLRYLASKAGLLYNDIELVNLDSDEVGSSFVSGKINVGATWEPWLSKAQERPNGKILVTSKDEPGIITDIVMARNDLIKTRRTDVQKLMRGFFAAQDWWEKNVNEGNIIVAKNFNLTPEEFAPMKDTVQLSNFEINMQKFDKTKPLNVYELTEKAADIYFNDGVIKTKSTGDAVTDSSLLNDLR